MVQMLISYFCCKIAIFIVHLSFFHVPTQLALSDQDLSGICFQRQHVQWKNAFLI